MRALNIAMSLYSELQCGRIYKDAEIVYARDMLLSATSRLQCGRIYKDAEMGLEMMRKSKTITKLQCGRIYKDAEIRAHAVHYHHLQSASMWPHL